MVPAQRSAWVAALQPHPVFDRHVSGLHHGYALGQGQNEAKLGLRRLQMHVRLDRDLIRKSQHGHDYKLS